jgi:hypothetical protein
LYLNGFVLNSLYFVLAVWKAKKTNIVMVTIRKLDKITLNLYDATEAGLSGMNLSCIRLDFSKLQANESGKRL